MDLKDILIDNYIPYAKGVIIERAIPNIDGFKPVVRRILYVMNENKLYKQNKKSQSIVGDVMKIHPNGDSSIYEALIRLTTGNGALNVPYIKSKGNFGRFFSKDISPAAPRYTEARLREVSELLFDGINENGVDMIPNYDNTTKEPALLPVKFPNIIVNDTNGIAVAMSSSIPCFGLVESCKAVIGMLDGSIQTTEELADCLIAPEFPTGGSVHMDRAMFLKILEEGKGSVTLTGTAELGKNKITITEVPYGVKIEDLIASVNNSEHFKDVSRAINLTDRNGMRVELTLKRGSDVEKLYKNLIRYSKFRTSLSYNTSVIMDKQCHTNISMISLLGYWIQFRLDTIKRVYEYRLEKKEKLADVLSVWEKIQGQLQNVIDIIVQNTEYRATEELKAKYTLTDIQVKTLLEMPIRSLTTDKLDQKLQELAKTREEIKGLTGIVNSEEQRKGIIVDELKGIIKKYGQTKQTDKREPIVLSRRVKEEVTDEEVKVIITRNNNLKRVMNPQTQPYLSEQDPIKQEIYCRNNTQLLIFTSTGICYKIKVNDIDNTRAIPNTYINSLIEPLDNGFIVHITSLDSADRLFTIINTNGMHDLVSLDRFDNNRKTHKNTITPIEDESDVIITTSKQVYVITTNNRAKVLNTNGDYSKTRLNKKIGTLKVGEKIRGIKDAQLVEIDPVLKARYEGKNFVNIKDKLI